MRLLVLLHRPTHQTQLCSRVSRKYFSNATLARCASGPGMSRQLRCEVEQSSYSSWVWPTSSRQYPTRSTLSAITVPPSPADKDHPRGITRPPQNGTIVKKQGRRLHLPRSYSREGFAACPNPLNAHADWTREGPTSRPPLPSQVLPLSLHASGYGIGIEVFVIVLANGRISRMGEAAHWLSGAVTWSPD